MTRRIDPILEETMNLYLDGRLSGPERAEFERRIERDEELREAVEFHRGLTLEFQEEAPPLPRDFAARARARLGRTRAGGAVEEMAPATRRRELPWWRNHFALATLGAAVAALLVVLVYPPLRLHLWQGGPEAERVATGPRAPDKGAPQPGAAGSAGGHLRADSDEATLQALRSLGYIASGKPGTAKKDVATGERKAQPKPAQTPFNLDMREKVGQVVPGGVGDKTKEERDLVARGYVGGAYVADADAAPPAPPPTVQKDAPPEEAGAPPRMAVGSAEAGPPEGASEPAPATPAPAGDLALSRQKEAPAPREGAVRFRALPLGRPPELDRDHQVIRSAPDWTNFLAGTAPPPPAVDFEREMVVVLRDDLGSDPPSRLRVVSVTLAADVLQIECRVDRPEAGSYESPPSAPGQALVVPAGAATVKIVVK